MDDIIVNSRLVRKIINRKASLYSQLDFILPELAQRVMSRLDYIKLSPERILDCGSGMGHDYVLLRNKFPLAQIIELDHTLNFLKRQISPGTGWRKIFAKPPLRLCADAYQLPVANQSINFCYANLLLPYLSDIPAFIREMRRILALGGAFCVAGLGVDTFKEIRALGLSTYRFPDMHDIGDMLVDAGFSNPVVDTEYITLSYADLKTMLADVKLVGCGAANDAKLWHSLSRELWQQLADTLANPAKLTLEIFVAHGWKDQNKIELPTGQSVINFKPRH